MKFIRLTYHTEKLEYIWINAQNIVAIKSMERGYTQVDTEISCYCIQETPEEIMRMIGAASGTQKPPRGMADIKENMNKSPTPYSSSGYMDDEIGEWYAEAANKRGW